MNKLTAVVLGSLTIGGCTQRAPQPTQNATASSQVSVLPEGFVERRVSPILVEVKQKDGLRFSIAVNNDTTRNILRYLHNEDSGMNYLYTAKHRVPQGSPDIGDKNVYSGAVLPVPFLELSNSHISFLPSHYYGLLVSRGPPGY